MKVLFGTDGSRYSLAAARFLSRWHLGSGTSVDLVSVTPHTRRSMHRYFGQAPGVAEQWRALARKALEETARPLHSQGYRVSTRIRVGAPAQVLVESAQAADYDLVVVGAKGQSSTPFFDVGSIALAVLEHVPTAVLMVRERDPKHRGRRLPTQLDPFRALVPTDGKGHSLAAVRRFVALLEIPRLEAHVVSAFEVADNGVRHPTPPTVRARERSRAESAARAALHDAVQILERRGIPTDARVLEGRPATAVVDASREMDADLIILGSRGVRRVQELHLGSVALEVARSAPCSILIAREA